MIITTANQKGGAGKTTTAIALATGAAALGRKVLLVDTDPQANATFLVGGDQNRPGTYELMMGTVKAADAVQKAGNIDLIGASYELSVIDNDLEEKEADPKKRVRRLKDALRPIVGNYDVVVFDTAPTLGIGLTASLVASNKVVIPVTSDITMLQGLNLLKDTIEGAKTFNKGLEVGGIVFTRWSGRTIQARDLQAVITETCESMGMPVYKTTIREAIAAREAQTYRKSIFDHAPNSTTATDYMALIEEMNL